MAPVQPYLFAIVAIAIVNGIFSPVVLPVAILVAPFLPSFFTSSAGVLFFVTSLLVSTGTIMLAGLPAALYERIRGEATTTEPALWIWLAATALLSLPAVSRFFEVGL